MSGEEAIIYILSKWKYREQVKDLTKAKKDRKKAYNKKHSHPLPKPRDKEEIKDLINGMNILKEI